MNPHVDRNSYPDMDITSCYVLPSSSSLASRVLLGIGVGVEDHSPNQGFGEKECNVGGTSCSDV